MLIEPFINSKTMKQLISHTTAVFEHRFGFAPAAIFLSPGRINIIGEHIDYNDGFVLPAAIDKHICFAISISNDSNCNVIAVDIDDEYSFNINDEIKPIEKTWANYILGVLFQYKEMKLPLKGFNIAFSSTIPEGAGLSSSAALECGFGFALNEMLNLGLSKEKIARIGQHAEHTFVGVMCGIMDQFSNMFGIKDKVIKLDCTSLEYEYHNADFGKYALVLIDSNVKHSLVTTSYNDRRKECEKGLEILKQNYIQIKTFRDCTKEQVEKSKELLGAILFKRCHFVVSEIQRVLDAVIAIESCDFNELGRLMYETHEGLSSEYEVSCDELDFLVDAAKNEDTVVGSRMMGGGFGGCSINLIEKENQDVVIERIAKAYKNAFGIDIEHYKISISDGTHQYKKIIRAL